MHYGVQPTYSTQYLTTAKSVYGYSNKILTQWLCLVHFYLIPPVAPWLWRFVAGYLPHTSGFNPRPVSVEFMVNRASQRLCPTPPSTKILPCTDHNDSTNAPYTFVHSCISQLHVYQHEPVVPLYYITRFAFFEGKTNVLKHHTKTLPSVKTPMGPQWTKKNIIM